MMNKNLLIALLAAMPVVAQDRPQLPEGAPEMPVFHKMERPQGQRPEMKGPQRGKHMERFDADKDGRISDAEREAMRAEFQKRGPKGPGFDKKGDRRRPHGERPEMGDAATDEFQKRGPKGPGFDKKGDRRRPHGERPEMGDAAKAEFQKRGPKGPEFGKEGEPRPFGPMPERN